MKDKEYYKNWYYKNWEKRRTYLKQKIISSCGSKISKGSKNFHMKTNKHIKKMECIAKLPYNDK